MSPRIAPLDEPWEPDLAQKLEAMMPPGVPPLILFRTLARNPRILDKVRLGNLLDRASFRLLASLFQIAVGEIDSVGIPVTISK